MKIQSIGLVLTLVSGMPSLASEERVGHSVTQVKSDRFRVRGFSEMMFPALGGTGYVPRSGGAPFVPPFLSSQIGMDYEFHPGLRILYVQKGLLIWPKIEGAPFTGRLLDPRFGVRKSQLLDVKNLSTDYDLFIQPGLTSAFVTQPGRAFDIGIRLTHRYGAPDSKLKLGLNFEVVWTSYSRDTVSSNLTGVIAPWASVTLSRKFSTQHWIYGFYKHQKGDPALKFSWDITGSPYMQSGIQYKMSDQILVTLLMNHYLYELPRASTVWSSLWFSFMI